MLVILLQRLFLRPFRRCKRKT